MPPPYHGKAAYCRGSIVSPRGGVAPWELRLLGGVMPLPASLGKEHSSEFKGCFQLNVCLFYIVLKLKTPKSSHR